MGVELELFVLLALVTVGFCVFTAFEVETPWWRIKNGVPKGVPTYVDGETLGKSAGSRLNAARMYRFPP